MKFRAKLLSTICGFGWKFDAFREYGNGRPKVMWKMLFCVALNPEVLYEAFAHGMMSKMIWSKRLLLALSETLL